VQPPCWDWSSGYDCGRICSPAFPCTASGDSESLENIVSKSPENEVNIICDLKRQLSIALEQRDQAEGKFVELQSEVAILRSYNRRSKKEQEKLQNEVAEKQKESQNLSQKTAELEHEVCVCVCWHLCYHRLSF
jgi:hypothetical protein